MAALPNPIAGGCLLTTQLASSGPASSGPGSLSLRDLSRGGCDVCV